MHSLTSALYGGELSTSRLGRFIPRERAPGIHWIGGWVRPTASLDAMVKSKNPFTGSARNRTPVVHPVRKYVLIIRIGMSWLRTGLAMWILQAPTHSPS